jgi:hypothetical protein
MTANADIRVLLTFHDDNELGINKFLFRTQNLYFYWICLYHDNQKFWAQSFETWYSWWKVNDAGDVI